MYTTILQKERYLRITSSFISANPFAQYLLREAELNNNIALARDACTLAVYCGFLHVTPHLYFPQFLNDDVAAERNLDLDMGKTLLRQCTQLWNISPRISSGISAEIKEAQKCGIPLLVFTAVEFR